MRLKEVSYTVFRAICLMCYLMILNMIDCSSLEIYTCHVQLNLVWKTNFESFTGSNFFLPRRNRLHIGIFMIINWYQFYIVYMIPGCPIFNGHLFYEIKFKFARWKTSIRGKHGRRNRGSSPIIWLGDSMGVVPPIKALDFQVRSLHLCPQSTIALTIIYCNY